LGQRVLATDSAKQAAERIGALITGSLAPQVKQVLQAGQALANPRVWDGPQAALFRTSQWPRWTSGLDAALQALGRLDGQARQVIADIERAGSQGPQSAVRGPAPAHHWWDGPVGFIEDLGGGLWDGVVSPVKMLWGLTGQALYDPGGAGANWKALGSGLLYGVEHPVEFGKALIDWKDWTNGHPGRAIGELLPTIALAVLSGGAGAAGRGAAGAADAERAAQAAADAERAAQAAADADRAAQAASDADKAAQAASGVGDSAAVGAARETRVADITGGTVVGEPGAPGLKVVEPGVGSTDVDVMGPHGEYIAVGGPGKALDLSRLGSKLRVLKYAADQAGVPAQAYFERGTPQTVIDLAKRRLGDDNVFIFDR
jgi:hypothetical protein